MVSFTNQTWNLLPPSPVNLYFTLDPDTVIVVACFEAEEETSGRYNDIIVIILYLLDYFRFASYDIFYRVTLLLLLSFFFFQNRNYFPLFFAIFFWIKNGGPDV